MIGVAIAVPISDSPAPVIPSRRRTMPDTPNFEPDEDDLYTFPQDLARVFRDAPSARLARALENSPRNAQKWANGSEPPPAHAIAFVNEQSAILTDLKPDPYGVLKLQCDALIAAGLHPEVVASMLSALYEEITGKTVR